MGGNERRLGASSRSASPFFPRPGRASLGNRPSPPGAQCIGLWEALKTEQGGHCGLGSHLCSGTELQGFEPQAERLLEPGGTLVVWFSTENRGFRKGRRKPKTSSGCTRYIPGAGLALLKLPVNIWLSWLWPPTLAPFYWRRTSGEPHFGRVCTQIPNLQTMCAWRAASAGLPHMG